MSDNQESTQDDPRNILEGIEDMCEKAGCLKEVGPDFYRAVLELPDLEMTEVIFDLVRHQSGYLKKRILKDGEPAATHFIQNMLHLVISGHIAFDEYGRIAFLKPVGPKPTTEMQRELDKRIENLEPLITDIIRKVLPPDLATEA